jgi:hypothetical protein
MILVSHVTFPPTPGLGSENINILLCIFCWLEGLEANPPDRYARHQVRTRHQTKKSTQYPPP